MILSWKGKKEITYKTLLSHASLKCLTPYKKEVQFKWERERDRQTDREIDREITRERERERYSMNLSLKG